MNGSLVYIGYGCYFSVAQIEGVFEYHKIPEATKKVLLDQAKVENKLYNLCGRHKRLSIVMLLNKDIFLVPTKASTLKIRVARCLTANDEEEDEQKNVTC